MQAETARSVHWDEMPSVMFMVQFMVQSPTLSFKSPSYYSRHSQTLGHIRITERWLKFLPSSQVLWSFFSYISLMYSCPFFDFIIQTPPLCLFHFTNSSPTSSILASGIGACLYLIQLSSFMTWQNMYGKPKRQVLKKQNGESWEAVERYNTYSLTQPSR